MRFVLPYLLASLLLPLTSCSVGKSVAAPEKNRDLISQAAFCDAYVLRDAEKRDHRPSAKEESFPLLMEGRPRNSILGKGGTIVDVAALASRVTAQARVSKEQISRLTAALQKTDSFHPMAACYNPHHAVVFYSEDGEPMCCIEICFSCNVVKTVPELRMVDGTDFVAMAEIFEELKLPLTPYKSLDALKKGKAEERRNLRIFLKTYAEEKEQALNEKQRH